MKNNQYSQLKPKANRH